MRSLKEILERESMFIVTVSLVFAQVVRSALCRAAPESSVREVAVVLVKLASVSLVGVMSWGQVRG